MRDENVLTAVVYFGFDVPYDTCDSRVASKGSIITGCYIAVGTHHEKGNEATANQV